MAARNDDKGRRSKTTAAYRREAVKLLRILAEREIEPGAKGYSLGMAERIEEGDMVTDAYLAQLRCAVADSEPAGSSTPGGR